MVDRRFSSRIFTSCLVAGQQRQPREVFHAADVRAQQARPIEALSHVRNVSVSVIEKLVQLRLLESAELVERAPLRALESFQILQGRAPPQTRFPTGVQASEMLPYRFVQKIAGFRDFELRNSWGHLLRAWRRRRRLIHARSRSEGRSATSLTLVEQRWHARLAHHMHRLLFDAVRCSLTTPTLAPRHVHIVNPCRKRLYVADLERWCGTFEPDPEARSRLAIASGLPASDAIAQDLARARVFPSCAGALGVAVGSKFG